MRRGYGWWVRASWTTPVTLGGATERLIDCTCRLLTSERGSSPPVRSLSGT